MFFLEIFLGLTQVVSKVQGYLFLADLTKSSSLHLWLCLFWVHAVWNTSKNWPLPAGNLRPLLASSQPRSLQLLHVQSFKLFKSSSVSPCLSITYNLFYLAKHPGQISQQTGLCLPTLAALLAHHRSVSTSSGRTQGMTPSASNTTGVLPVTKHSIPDMLYITYISKTAHTVCSPCSQGKSIPTGPGFISQCWALYKRTWYILWAARPHSHEVFIFFVWGMKRNRKGVWGEKESLGMLALNLHANKEGFTALALLSYNYRSGREREVLSHLLKQRWICFVPCATTYYFHIYSHDPVFVYSTVILYSQAMHSNALIWCRNAGDCGHGVGPS